MSQPIDHRDIIRRLSDEQRRILRQKSDQRGLSHLAGHMGLIAFSGIWIALGWPGWQLALLPHGIFLVFLFTLLHETVHDTPFQSLWLNRIAGHFSGFVIILAQAWFRYFHLAHHRHTHDPDKDPELASGKPDTWQSYLIHLSGFPVWIFQIKTFLRLTSGNAEDVFLPQKARTTVIREARWIGLIYLTLFIGSLLLQNDLLLWIWIFPMILGQPFLRAYLLAEHTFCPHVANMLENTRTTYTLAIVRFIAWNMPYHTEHHTYPVVPFHQLPLLHKIMKEDLRQTESGYSAFHQKYVDKL